jgi:hypothetical protein
VRVRHALLALAASGIALLSAAPAMAASTPAAAGRSAPAAGVTVVKPHGEAVVLVSRPGTRAGAVSSAPEAPAFQLVAVSPRVSCGGFNGNVQWSGNSVEIWGEVWDTCGGYTYVYLSWNNPTHHNQAVGTAQPRDTDGVSAQTFKGGLNVSNIAVTTCSTYGGWHCGTPVYV